MKQKMKKVVAFLLSASMLMTALPTVAFARKNDYVEREDDYYKLISKSDWELAPGITESEIILDNATQSHRQVAHVVEVDLNNQYTKVMPSYKEMKPQEGNYSTQVMSEQAKWAEANGYGNVVAAMNLSLSWYNSEYYQQHPELVGEPLGYMVLNGEMYTNSQGQTEGAQTCVVINFDEKNGEERPADMPKVQIRSTSDPITGWEEQVIPANFGFLVKDGKNQSSKDHTANNGASRSFVGIKADGTFVMVMNDGRQSPYSAGFTTYEMGEFMLSLGCVQAINGDGGGSSTFLSQRPGEELKLNCSPSDGAERPTTHGVLVISTAPANGEFARATITTEHEYYTPNSTVTFSAVGTDLVGTKTEIPDTASWQLADPSMGTIENGVFVSNGKTGTATAQLVYGGEVVGEASVEIVIPTELTFSQGSITVPFDQTVTIGFNATINAGLHNVELKPEDIELTSSNENLGTFNGFEFTSVKEEDAPDNLKATLSATLVHNREITATAELKLGKGSEVLFDFEEADDITSWNIADVNGNDLGFSQTLSHATTQNGKVHDGTGSMKVEMNPISAPEVHSGGYAQSDLYLNEGIILENATSIGFWAYIPDEYVNCWIRVRYHVDSNNDGIFETKNTVTVMNQPEVYDKWDESNWKYFSVDVSKYDKILIAGRDSKNIMGYADGSTEANNLRFIEFMYPHTGTNDLWKNYGTMNALRTVYIDNVTVDYSDAVDDREAPIFGAVTLADNDNGITLSKHGVGKTTDNSLTVSAVVKEDTVKTNATGLDLSSAKAYIDGIETSVTYANNKLTISNVSVANGVHRIKFEIADKAGNKSVVVRLVKVESAVDASTVQLVPRDPSLDRLYGGSVYWMDVKANKIETIKSVKMVVDLNAANHWELAHMELAEGFEAEFSEDIEENTATIIITRTGKNIDVGEQTIASLPIRVTYYDTDIKVEGYNAMQYWQSYRFWPYDLKVDVDLGQITYVDGYTSNVLNTFSNEEFSVDLEMYTIPADMDATFKAERNTAHVHQCGAPETVDATCTKNGYSGRTTCSICKSVVEWGKTTKAKGHSWSINAQNKLACSVDGTLYNGVYDVDGKMYIKGSIANGWNEDNTSYYEDGVKLTGSHYINGVMYTFDEDGNYLPNYSYTGFYNDGTGWMYFLGNFQKKGFVVIDGNTHYFDDRTGYAPVGSFTLAEDRVYKVEGEQGKVIGAWDTFIVDGVERRRYYYSLRYYKNQWLEIDGEKYFFNNDGYALIGKRAVAANGVYLGGYEFDTDGKLLGAITGPFTDAESGYMYFADNGVLACNKLVKYGKDYYFARKNYLLITWATSLTEEQTGGMLPAGEYQFGQDGKLIMLNGPVKDAFNDAYWTFYQNGVRVYEEGLYKYEGDYYYVRSNGLLLTWNTYVDEDKANGLLPAGEYQFGADGKLIMLNGPVKDAFNDTYWNFYKDGVRMYEEGLYKYEENYYYVRDNGLLLTWNTYVSEDKANGLLPAGEYQFGADGKLIMLNGPVKDTFNNAYWNFYKDGVRVYEEGLYKYETDYYYVRSNGLLLTWNTYVDEDKANGLLPAGEYKFGTDGKLIMLNGPVKDAFNDMYWNFYKDGVRVYEEGLYKYETDYYYVRSNGLLLTWNTYVDEEKANGLLPAGEYKFGTDGKLIMLNGPVKDAFNDAYWNFYKDGVRVYEEGLYQYEENYYYVRSNGLLLTWNMYIEADKTNGLLPAGEYQFGADGKLNMLNGPVKDALNEAYWNFYKNGVRIYEEGLYEYDGNYYYVRANGLLQTWATYITEEKANGLVAEGTYEFGEDGKMIR